MPSPRAPWWMDVVAASFLGFFGFNIYADFVAPEASGITAYDFSRSSLHLKAIAQGSALERVGIRVGDRIIAVDGNVLHEFADWEYYRLLFRRARPIDLEIERDGTRIHRTLTLAGVSSFPGGNVAYFAWRAAMLSCLVISFFVFLRPDNLSARLASLMLATFVASLPILGHGDGWGAT